MYFDPLSSWLVTLIADGIMIAGDMKRSRSAGEPRNDVEKSYNDNLNGIIRRLKKNEGFSLPEMTYEQIQKHIRFANRYLQGRINLDLNNQEYIITLLEECAKQSVQYNPVKKIEWYKNAAIEARRRKEQYIKALEEARIKAAEEQRKQNITNTVLSVVAIILIAIVVVIFLAQL